MNIRAYLILFAFLALSDYSLEGFAQESSQRVTWVPWADDLEVAELGQEESASLAPQLTLVRSRLTKYRPIVVRAAEYGWKGARVHALCKKSKASVCINANFFDEQGDALGLIISRGIQYHDLHRGGNTLTGIFQAGRERLSIVNRSDFHPEAIMEAVQAGPRIITKGHVVTGLRDSSRARRAGVCIDAQNRLIVYAVSSALVGISIDQLQKILLTPGIGCAEALNLDGGGSAQLYVAPDTMDDAKSTREIMISGYDDIPVALALIADSW